jgi:chemotaxis receptor (MCP) glutamine deamidase CheD
VCQRLLITAMATLGAFLYNICASLVGGAQF